MKAGLTTSLALHAVVLGFAVFSLSSPRPLDMSIQEIPVTMVSYEEFTQLVQGDRESTLEEAPTPTPTTREDVVEDAQTVGDNTVDLSTPPTPDPKPRPVETAEAPPPAPVPPQPDPAPVPEPEPEPQPEPQPVPATEVAPEPQPQQEVTPDPVPETTVAEAPQPEGLPLPDNAPRPQARPEPPPAQTARTPERREPERPVEQRRTPPPSSEPEADRLVKDVADLLTQESASGGGTRRSSDQAALGDRQTTGQRLTQSEIGSLQRQIESCWRRLPGMADSDDLAVSITLRLTPAGELDGDPIVVSSNNTAAGRAAESRAYRAVLRCAPYNAPADKYEAWADIQFNFRPSDSN